GYLQLIDVATYLNHYYLAGLLALLLAVSPAPRAHSFDARFGVCRSAERVSALWLYLFRFQIAVVYSFAGFAKAQADWLVHAEPLSIWIGSHTDMPVVGPVLAAPWAPWVASWAGFLFDSSIAWLLSSRRLRPFAFAAVIAFHVFTGMLFPIGMFPVIMVLAALVFFPPDWPRSAANLVRRLVGRPPAGSAPRSDDTGAVGEPRSAGSSSRQRRVGLALVMIYCVLQLVVPLRFLLYRGNVLWHEQGMRFSWRVMVREKNGSVTFVVRDKTSDRIWEVNPRSYLTRIQERETSTQPDLILQLAHRIRSDFEKRGIGPVEVRADVLVSLNGRRLARLIDPDVDLARVSDGIGRAGWILPSPVDVPPRLRPL
ncbi:MAG TPA: HTTM domain-containing protein, partial [Polyangiaceae bacterium]|nr:HTTM domain-containing protein [Polyangiaceae bacterium]